MQQSNSSCLWAVEVSYVNAFGTGVIINEHYNMLFPSDMSEAHVVAKQFGDSKEEGHYGRFLLSKITLVNRQDGTRSSRRYRKKDKRPKKSLIVTPDTQHSASRSKDKPHYVVPAVLSLSCFAPCTDKASPSYVTREQYPPEQHKPAKEA